MKDRTKQNNYFNTVVVKEVNNEALAYSRLFDFFNEQHDLTLLHGEMDDIIKAVDSFKEKYNEGIVPPDLETALKKRIKELKEVDALFCKDRWDMTKLTLERNLAREMSNQVTFARQELERILNTPPGDPDKTVSEEEFCKIYSALFPDSKIDTVNQLLTENFTGSDLYQFVADFIKVLNKKG